MNKSNVKTIPTPKCVVCSTMEYGLIYTVESYYCVRCLCEMSYQSGLCQYKDKENRFQETHVYKLLTVEIPMGGKERK